MPVYNGAQFVRASVESVLDNGFADLELVIGAYRFAGHKVGNPETRDVTNAGAICQRQREARRPDFACVDCSSFSLSSRSL